MKSLSAIINRSVYSMLVLCSLSFSQNSDFPRVLTLDAAKHYIDLVKLTPSRTHALFSFQREFLEELQEHYFHDSSDIQAFQFPNGLTVLAVADLALAGAVVFKTGSDSILTVHCWSDVVIKERPKDSEAELVFEQTGYKFTKAAEIWNLTAFIVARFEPEYQLWHFSFDLDPQHSGSGGGGCTAFLVDNEKRKNQSLQK
jgi:hypothetical protein